MCTTFLFPTLSATASTGGQPRNPSSKNKWISHLHNEHIPDTGALFLRPGGKLRPGDLGDRWRSWAEPNCWTGLSNVLLSISLQSCVLNVFTKNLFVMAFSKTLHICYSFIHFHFNIIFVLDNSEVPFSIWHTLCYNINASSLHNSRADKEQLG